MARRDGRSSAACTPGAAPAPPSCTSTCRARRRAARAGGVRERPPRAAHRARDGAARRRPRAPDRRHDGLRGAPARARRRAVALLTVPDLLRFDVHPRADTFSFNVRNLDGLPVTDSAHELPVRPYHRPDGPPLNEYELQLRTANGLRRVHRRARAAVLRRARERLLRGRPRPLMRRIDMRVRADDVNLAYDRLLPHLRGGLHPMPEADEVVLVALGERGELPPPSRLAELAGRRARRRARRARRRRRPRRRARRALPALGDRGTRRAAHARPSAAAAGDRSTSCSRASTASGRARTRRRATASSSCSTPSRAARSPISAAAPARCRSRRSSSASPRSSASTCSTRSARTPPATGTPTASTRTSSRATSWRSTRWRSASSAMNVSDLDVHVHLSTRELPRDRVAHRLGARPPRPARACDRDVRARGLRRAPPHRPRRLAGGAARRAPALARARRDAVALGDERDDVAHDLREVEVLRRVDRGDAGGLQRRDVGLGDDPADDDRRVDAGVAQRARRCRG